MRTFEEIKGDIDVAVATNDAAWLRSLAQEMSVLGTRHAEAAQHAALGVASFIVGDYAAAMEYFNASLALREELDDRAGVGRITSNIGGVLQALGDFPAAMQHYRRALEIAEELGARGSMASATGNMGVVYQSMGDFTSAMEHYRQVLAVYEELNNRTGIAIVVGRMGNVYQATGDYPLAMEHYRRSLAANEELGDRTGVALHTGNMGNVYAITGDYPVALEYYRRAMALHEELADRPGVARVTGNIGYVYMSIGDYTSAMEQYQRALSLHEALGERAGVANAILNIGSVCVKTGDYLLAMEHYRRARALLEELGDRASAAVVTDNLVVTLLTLERFDEAADLLARETSMQIDDPQIRASLLANNATIAQHQQDLDGAQEYLQQALKIVSDVGVRSATAEYHKQLRDLAQKRNDFAGYIEHNNEYTRITEEIKGTEATQKIAMMEAERKVEAELRERDKERTLLYGALPESIATRMVRGEDVSGDHFDNASVLFLDIVGFTTISDRIPAGHVVHLLKAIFKICDDVCTKHGLTKIKTIGDSYLAVAGIPDMQEDHAMRAALAAVDMLKGLNALELTMDPKFGDTSWTKDVGEITVRIGLHCGPLVAGIVGEQRLQYDVWGDTVNVASRMESTGEPGRIHLSEAFKDSLTPCLPDFLTLEERGEVVVKGKGPMTTYWLEGRG